jgi:hypothetical protein
MYTPNSEAIFQAAYVGAMGGMAASNRVPTDPIPTDAVNLGAALVAGAFAIAFDTAWGLAVPSSLDVDATEEVCVSAWWGRAPQANVPAMVNPATYTKLADALIALVDAADSYFASQGITPPPIGGSGVTNVTASAPITSTGGATPNIAITPATDLAAGSMSAADKTKLDGLALGGSNIIGNFATRPATAPTGSQFVTRDGPVDFVFDGTLWLPLISGNVLQPPPAVSGGGWTIVSGGTGGAAPGAITDAQGTVLITPGTRDTLYFPPQSGTPTQIIAAFDQSVNPNWHGFVGGGNPGFGVAIFQPAVTGVHTAYWRFANYYGNDGVQHAQLQSFTGTAFPFGAGSVPFDQTGTPPLGGKYQYFRITWNDPAPGNATFSISANGEDWVATTFENPAFQDAGQPTFAIVSFGQNPTAALSRLYSVEIS